MNLARVFPRVTKATPRDLLAFYDVPTMFPPVVDEVHVSVAFTFDIERAEWLAFQWKDVAPIKIGGPAFNQAGGDFVAGRYLKEGYTITSRGCPNKCWFCAVWKREPELKELPIVEGYNVLDDNLLACSENHIRAVFAMLKKQKRRAEFTGGLEAKRLKPWHVELLKDLNPLQMFFAYDTPDDEEPLRNAAKILTDFTMRQKRCFVLIGYPKDTITQAERRIWLTVKLGFMPMAMLWRDEKGSQPKEWKQFQRSWCRPAAIQTLIKSQIK